MTIQFIMIVCVVFFLAWYFRPRNIIRGRNATISFDKIVDFDWDDIGMESLDESMTVEGSYTYSISFLLRDALLDQSLREYSDIWETLSDR